MGTSGRRSSSDSMVDFRSEKPEDAILSMEAELSKIRNATKDIIRNNDQFRDLFAQYLEEKELKLDWSNIKPPKDGSIVPYDSISHHEEVNTAFLNKLAVLKLNGGLGTSMGCVGPKSAISVRNDATFLDLCVKQIEYLNREHDANVPLVLMNSFNTNDDTRKILRKYGTTNLEILTFNQSQYPRILKETLQPLPTDTAITSEWYPPGHGDLYRSLESSGMLRQLIEMVNYVAAFEGKEWMFVSNIDNLGAVVDLNILNYLCKERPDCEFVMEVTDKTRADVKGGTLIDYDGSLRLLEVAQVPKEHMEEFKSVHKFRVFNTNNLWINLPAIERLLKRGSLHMEIIENKKVLDDGRVVIQLEQAVGAAIKCFSNSLGINVPRSRFLPVKKTSDLMLVMSNLYRMKHGMLLMRPERHFGTVPLIKLGDNHFKKVKEFLRRFEDIPDILELDHLTVSGDVRFGNNVSLRGTVIIIANEGNRIDIPSGSILENKIVSGNLHILEH
eukprot:gene11226-3276_t